MLDQLNKQETKPTLQVFMNMFEQLLTANNIGFSSIKVAAYKDMKNVGSIVIDDSKQVVVGKPDNGEKDKSSVVTPKEEIVEVKEEPVVLTPKTSVISSKSNTPIQNNDDNKVQNNGNSKKKVGGNDMPMEPKKYMMDQEHYNKILLEIEELKRKRNDINSGRKEAWDASAGDGWDSPEFEEIERQEAMVVGEIASRLATLENAIIVEKQDDENIVDIGDIVRLSIDFGRGDEEENIYKLTGGESGDIDGLIHISINSPMGASIYQKNVGATTGYQVNDRKFKVQILEKLLEFEKGKTK